MTSYNRGLSDEELDRNIIGEYSSMPIAERTNEDFDNLLRTLDLVWNHKIYQDGLIADEESANRELYDLSITMAQGLIEQDNGTKQTMVKYKDRFKKQADTIVSSISLDSVTVVFTRKKLRQILIYYLDKDPLFFLATKAIEGCPGHNHEFSFGEVVVNEVTSMEVVVVSETKETIEYVTKTMLLSEDKYILPQIELKSFFTSSHPSKRSIVEQRDVIELYNEYVNVFERLN